MGKKTLQWHPGFQAALQVELMEDREYLVFQEEYNLSRKPLQMDTLIIKRTKDYAVKKSMGKIFREYNVVEYKSPEDYVSINDFYKVVGYACIYQSDTKTVLEIPPDEITLTLVCSHYPRKMIEHLQMKYKAMVRKAFQGIYYIEGLIFPLQILVTDKLSKEEYVWLGRLKGGLEVKEMEPLAREYKSNIEDPLYQAAMDLIIRANLEHYEEVGKMCDALEELFADELKRRVECGRMSFFVSLIRKKQEKGMAVDAIVDVLENVPSAGGTSGKYG